MRNLMISLVIFVMSTSFCLADSNLKMKISGPVTDNRYFLCVSHAGCVSILNGNKGMQFPLDQGTINNIIAVNAGDHSFSPQALPASCSITVKDNQTVTVTGHLVQNKQNHVTLSNLHCSVKSGPIS